MGYYSEVGICIKKEDFNKLKEKAEAQKKNIVLNFLAAAYTFENSDNTISIKWECIKWYSDFEEVKYIEDFLLELRTQQKPYHFIRIGENPGDVDIENYYGDEYKDYDCGSHMSMVSYIDMYD